MPSHCDGALRVATIRGDMGSRSGLAKGREEDARERSHLIYAARTAGSTALCLLRVKASFVGSSGLSGPRCSRYYCSLVFLGAELTPSWIREGPRRRAVSIRSRDISFVPRISDQRRYPPFGMSRRARARSDKTLRRPSFHERLIGRHEPARGKSPRGVT